MNALRIIATGIGSGVVGAISGALVAKDDDFGVGKALGMIGGGFMGGLAGFVVAVLLWA